MNSEHTPNPEFINRLEWELQSVMRRRASVNGASGAMRLVGHMRMNSVMRVVAATTMLSVCVPIARAEMVVETVTVGNPGNMDDAEGEGYGGVDYSYNIGMFEVTAGQYVEFLNAVAATDTYGLYNPSMNSDPYGCRIVRTGSPGSFSYSVAPDWADRPVNCVSWGDAARFANWLHNEQPIGVQSASTTENGAYDLSTTQSYYLPNGQTPETGSSDWYALNSALLAIERKEDASWVIPSEDEWYKAAYYDGGSSVYYDYPTGTDDVPSNVLSDPDPDPGNNANFTESGHTIGSPYYRTLGGDFENSRSPYGTFDQGGNVWEWIGTSIGSSRSLRGGCFHSSHSQLHAAHRDGQSYPSGEDGIIGFRVAELTEQACGDGLVDVGEGCDDGATVDGDGCSATCTVEPGWVCTGEPSICALPVCGNGLVEPGEGCDDGATVDGDGCSATCTVEAGWRCADEPSVCLQIPVPAVSEWGLFTIALLVLTAGTLVCARRKPGRRARE